MAHYLAVGKRFIQWWQRWHDPEWTLQNGGTHFPSGWAGQPCWDGNLKSSLPSWWACKHVHAESMDTRRALQLEEKKTQLTSWSGNCLCLNTFPNWWLLLYCCSGAQAEIKHSTCGQKKDLPINWKIAHGTYGSCKEGVVWVAGFHSHPGCGQWAWVRRLSTGHILSWLCKLTN